MARLDSISTRDLVKEIATREGVTRHLVGVEDLYFLRVRSGQGDTHTTFDLGPAVILVVVD
ncbi:hypothetical protein [Candidatus Darwinibacter acetoxidans]